MRIKKLKLVNFKQHRELWVDLDANLLGIVGKNGSGKSNLLGAIQFALTGAQPGFNKADLTSWGETKGEVVLEFEHQGKDYVLTRETSSSAVTLERDGFTVTGADNVAQALESEVIDPDLVNQVVFVNQSQIDDILFEKPAARAKSFQRMIGLGDAGKVHDNLGSTILSLGPQVDHSSSIESLNDSIKESEESLAANESIVKAITSKYGKGIDVTLELLNGSVIEIKEQQDSVNKLRGLVNEFEAVSAALLNAKNEPVREVPEVPDEPAGTEELSNTLDEVNRLIVYVGKLNDTVNKLSKVSDELSELKGDSSTNELEASIEDSEKRLASTVTTIGEISSEMAGLQSLKISCDKARGALGDEATCPLCGSEVSSVFPDDKQKRLDLLKKDMDSHKTTKDMLESTIKESRDYISTINAKISSLTQEKESLEKTLEELAKEDAGPPNLCDLSMEELTDLQKSLRDNINKASSLYRQWSNLKSAAESVETLNGERAARIKKMEEELARVDKNLRDASADDKVVDMVSSGVDLSSKLADVYSELSNVAGDKQRLTVLGDTNKVLRDKLLRYKEELAALKQKVSDARLRNEKIDRLKSVRGWFHHSNGPGQVVSMVLERITPTVNYFLGRFGAPFLVESEEATLGFKFHMTDSSFVPATPPAAKALSGAQKNILALSFRLACYYMFASRLGVLVLDEPTAHLDADNVGKFGELLQRLQVLAEDLGFQIIVVTHHMEILPFFDKVVAL